MCRSSSTGFSSLKLMLIAKMKANYSMNSLCCVFCLDVMNKCFRLSALVFYCWVSRRRRYRPTAPILQKFFGNLPAARILLPESYGGAVFMYVCRLCLDCPNCPEYICTVTTQKEKNNDHFWTCFLAFEIFVFK